MHAGVIFGYFEILLKSDDVGFITQEKVRLQSFEQTMRAVGIDYDIIVDMFDYTWDLFDDILKAVERGDRTDSVLLESMNDENKSNSIVYHVKVGFFRQKTSHADLCVDDDLLLHADSVGPL